MGVPHTLTRLRFFGKKLGKKLFLWKIKKKNSRPPLAENFYFVLRGVAFDASRHPELVEGSH